MTEWWRQAATAPRRPVLFAVGVSLVYFVVVLAIAVPVGEALAGVMPARHARLVGQGLAHAVGALLTVLLLARTRWWALAGLDPRAATRARRPVLVVIVLIGVFCLAFVPVVAADPFRLVVDGPNQLLVAFAEEAIFRGVVLGLLLAAWTDPAGPRRAVVVAAVVFGGGHLANLIVGGSVSDTVLQAFTSTLLGIGFGAVRAWTNDLRPLVALHAVADLVSSTLVQSGVKMSGVSAALILVSTAALAVYGLYALRPRAIAASPAVTRIRQAVTVP